MHDCIAIVEEEDTKQGRPTGQQARTQGSGRVIGELPVSGRQGAQVMLQGSQGGHALPAGLTHPPHL